MRPIGLLLLCVALGACGGGEPQRYEDEFPPIDRGLVALGQDVEAGLRQANDRTVATRFAAYARRLADLRGRLADLEPPDSLRDRHDALLAAMTATRRDLDGIAAAARQADAVAARQAAVDLVGDATALDEARRALADAL